MVKKGRIVALSATVLLSAAGFFLRRHQLNIAFDGSGLPNGKGVWPLVILCVLAVAGALFAALKTEKRSGIQENFSNSPAALGLLFLAAGLMAASGAYELINAQPASNMANLMLDRGTAVLSIATGLCFVAMAANWYKGTEPSKVAWLLPTVYYILRLIFRFKDWSADPIILDYCFGLLSLVFCLMAVFHIGGFAVGEGKRRVSLFFCLCGVFFSAVTLADGGFTHVLSSLGGMCFLGANAWQLLGEKK